MTKTTLIILAGPSGTGKSTVTQYLLDRLDKVAAISKDFFRCLIHNGKYKYDTNEELLINGLFNDRLISLLFRGNMNYIILDNTHLENLALADIFEVCKGFDVDKKVIFFDPLGDGSPSDFEERARELRKRHLGEGRELSIEKICWQISRSLELERIWCKDPNTLIIKTKDLSCEDIANKILSSIKP